ncbi:hypothetical protein FOTG_16025 [Fusarium oxysporum f. sp. vasinfectum 25433]|uniref:Uncharacterized protein n=1 Tax=Fusarium oxysporum f. sp. vasinfectum 25433 TaxID=1089449 RepID=X0L3I8_FUSOX|nr:hypothetical protein FOTG_16025 [Fusarium oxysporum f. sp. vasinfectum 25433]
MTPGEPFPTKSNFLSEKITRIKKKKPSIFGPEDLTPFTVEQARSQDSEIQQPTPVAAAFRMILTPIDTLKTTLQAQGARGTALLTRRVNANSIGSLWWGAFATATATFVGHYPWFATTITEPPRYPLVWWLLRLAFIGFCASVISDSITNPLRVVKTYRQVNDTKVSYAEAARAVVIRDGVVGLLGRGLKTRILANGLQGIMFSILWKLFLDLWEKRT